MKKPFTLYKRPTKKKNRYIYYVQFRDYEGNRLTAVSSGQTSKSAAEVWAYEKLKEGSIKSLKDPKFSVFAQNWFVWGRKCPYLKKCLNRGSYSRSYADYQRAILKNHILPYFANRRLSEITVSQIENLLLYVKEIHSSATANRSLSVLKIMFKETFRLGVIQKDSASLVQKLQERSREKGILTIDEARLLLNPQTVTSLWEDNLKHYYINLLACTTGMRLGEGHPSITGLSKGLYNRVFFMG
jgi:integrase